MPFLSSVPLNPLRSGTQRLLANPQRMHAAVEGVLPPRPERRLLWRLDRRGPETSLLILSPEHPSLSHIVEQAGWPEAASGAPRVANLDPLLSNLAIGRQFAFRTRLNPVQNIPSPGRRGVRRGHRTLAHQLEWFVRRVESGAWGFRLLEVEDAQSVSVVEREQLQFTRAGKQSRVSISTATFEGVLEVADSAKLKESLLGGLGSAKAYGCGLLTLAKAKSHVVER